MSINAFNTKLVNSALKLKNSENRIIRIAKYFYHIILIIKQKIIYVFELLNSQKIRIIRFDKSEESLLILKEKSVERVNFSKIYNFSEGGWIDFNYQKIEVRKFTNAQVYSESDFIVTKDGAVWEKYFRPQWAKIIPVDKDLLKLRDPFIIIKKPKHIIAIENGFSLCGVHCKIWAHFLVQYLPKLYMIHKIQTVVNHELAVIIPKYKDSQIRDIVCKHLSLLKYIKIVSMHHEQAAAMAADAYGRITNKPGVALATSGPGATNLLTGIGNCYFDSVPAIFLTGQVNVNEQKGENPTRQIGFQETDIVSMAKPVTKAAFLIKSANEIPQILETAYNIAISGRPGPVLLDIPMNIQIEEINPDFIKSSDVNVNFPSENPQLYFQNYINALESSKRPLILVGRGIRASGSIELFRKFIQKLQIPVVTSLLGLDALQYHNSQRIGFIGTYGNRWANYALGNCDLLLVLGSRLDLRQTGIDTLTFQQGKKIYHVDIDDAELNNRLSECVILKADLHVFLSHSLDNNISFKSPVEWIKTIEQKKQSRPDTSELEKVTGINPNIFLHELSKVSSRAGAFVTDVGNNQMWCSQSLELSENQLFLTSGGMGAMGYSLPAAIGAAFTLNNMPVVAISGDGGFQINIQELQTIRRNNLPVKIVILNNHCLGMIRQFQDAYFDSCYQSTVWGYNTPDFTKVASAYGIDSFSISNTDEVHEGLTKLWNNPSEPFLLEVNIDIHTNVFPKMMFGSPITIMEPNIEENYSKKD